MTEEELVMHDRIIGQGGYAAPIKWYKSVMRGIDNADEADFTEKDKSLAVPIMLVVSEKDYATRMDMQLMHAKELVKNLRVETLDCGHWIPLEGRHELASLLKGFANEVATKWRHIIRP